MKATAPMTNRCGSFRYPGGEEVYFRVPALSGAHGMKIVSSYIDHMGIKRPTVLGVAGWTHPDIIPGGDVNALPLYDEVL